MALFRCASGSSGGGATITVTYSSDFYGETVTCSHGTKTYSKVATSSGTLEFSVDEEGTWTISCTIGSDTFSTTADVDLSYDAELVSLPDGETVLPTDDIETWLACAAITDKAYTTLSQVLADSVTYNALLGDSNACAYMKRSTTWTTDICASQYAMNLLGQYDTACDALLSDSTWASAIANSTYFESVLNVKVPVMTSNTTPSGEASASSNYNAPPYLAFDGDAGTYWMASSTSNESITYDFGEPVVVMKMFLGASSIGAGGVRVHDYIIQGSNDGSTYTDIQSGTHGSTDETVSISNDTAYRYCRLFIENTATGQAGYFIAVNTLQFYGRKSSGEKIHGGNPTYDSFYRIVDGNNVPVTDPSLLDAGTYTIYSNGLAKDPSNLSNDYGKTVRICPNTKEIVVRPDNTLYWWGWESPDLEDCTTANGWSLTNNSLLAPTHNTNDIYFGQSTGQKAYGVGSRNTAITNSYSVINKCVSGGMYMASYASKSLNTYIQSNTITNTAISKNTLTMNDTSYHVGYWGPANISTYLYAMWYE